MKLLNTYNNSKRIITAATWYRGQGYYLVKDPNHDNYGMNNSVRKATYTSWRTSNNYKLIEVQE